MTPKEKAKELVDKYYNESPLVYNWAKQSALIAVDEIIHICPYQTYKETLHPYDGAELSTDYWNEVKQEIEKL